MATPTSFSYAQAAKGQGTTPSNTSNPAEKGEESQSSDVAPPAVDLDATQSNTASVPEAVSSDTRPVEAEKQEVENTQGSESDAKSDAAPEKTSEPKRDEDVSKLDRPWRRNEKSTRSSSSATRNADDQDTRKARRGKKGKSAEKQAGEQPASGEKEQEAEPEPPKVELTEAPIPSVNIWTQRQEAQLTKTKSPESETNNGASEEPKTTKSTAEDSTTVVSNGPKAPRKVADSGRPERNGVRGSRVSEKESRDVKGVIPPPVADSSSWPTPETAIKEISRKGTDKSDRSDKDSQEDASQSKSRQKWVAYDYVPTVSFETQLPQMRNTKSRGGARSARDPGTRAATVAEKAPSASPTNKSSESRDKPREANSSSRNASIAPAAKRAPLDTPNARDQKKPSAQGNAEKTKEAVAQSVENTQAPRERPEGRGDRGRGGYRGRGAHHAVNSQSQHQHSASASGNFGGSSRSHGPYSPPPRQGGHGGMFMPPPQRGRGRNSAGNYHRMSLPNGSSRVAPVQTQFAPYDYPVAPMTAIPFQSHPYWENMYVPMLKSQVEYYFSIENLCKDMFLRRRMDSQGFVPLHFIAAFKRMQELSGDISLIRSVCEESVDVEYVIGDDDCERLRRREGWENFVLPMEDRDELARNNGPAHVTYKNRSYQLGAQFNGMPPMPYGVVPPAAYGPSDMSMPHYAEGGPVMNGVNGASSLSAEVPDFAPSGASVVGSVDTEKLKAAVGVNANADVATSHGLTNGHVEAPATNGLTNGVHAQES